MKENIHISLRDPARVHIFWMDIHQNGIDPYLSPKDPWGLNQINPVATARLRGLLQYALTPNHPNPERLARVISGSFLELQGEFEQIEKRCDLDSPTFLIPEPLRGELGITDEVMPVGEWVRMFPPSNADADSVTVNTMIPNQQRT